MSNIIQTRRRYLLQGNLEIYLSKYVAVMQIITLLKVNLFQANELLMFAKQQKNPTEREEMLQHALKLCKVSEELAVIHVNNIVMYNIKC